MRICLVSAEVAPFAKTGGLGDVAAALALYLAKHGHDVRTFLPLYGKVDRSGQEFTAVPYLQDVPVSMGGRTYAFSVFTAPLPRSSVLVHFIACPALYGRNAIYASEGDEHLRFALLTRAAIECCQRMAFAPHVFHANDWHTALLPLYLKTTYAWDRLFERSRTVLTLHNLAYQGGFPAEHVRDVGLDGAWHLLHQDDLRAGRFGFLTTGILHANAITAVSPTYAREIQTPEQGFGLDPLLRARSASVHGILNGVDYDEWSPERDAHLAARYSAADLSGKDACRRDLLARAGLAPDPRGPVLGIVSRLTSQKGFEITWDVLAQRLAWHDVRLVVLGSGSDEIAGAFRDLERRFPGKAHFHQGYDNAHAHRVEAGSDLFLMPSLFEPCGLNQMYSLRYGTVPLVRKTGGLADTVEPWDRAADRGTGFVFEHFTAAGFAWALDLALTAWEDRAAWRRLQQRGMAQDFSWDRRIGEYLRLYASL